MKKTSKRKHLLAARAAAAVAITAGVLVSFSSCGDKQKTVTEGDPPTAEPGEDPKPSPTPTSTPIATTPVSGTTQSEHFAAVAQHLDLGGTVFGYLDVDGDVEKIAEVAQGFFDLAKEQSGGDMPPHLMKLELSSVLGKLGLDGVEAIGMSSYMDGDMYRNKAYIHVPAGRKGLLKIVGGDARPFVARTLAPEDADLIFEQTIDARAGFNVVSAMVADLGGPEAAASFQKSVAEAVQQLGLSMADLFRKLDTRITVVGRIHPDKPLEIPDAPMKIPSFDLLISLDDMGWLYEKVTKEMKKEIPPEQQAQMFVKGEGFERLGLPPMPDPEMVIVQPVIQHDIANKRVLIATSPAFLSECLAGASKLSDSAEFAKATAGLPTEGNGLSFVSERYSSEYRKLLVEMMQSDPGGTANDAREMALMSKMLDGFLPKSSGSQASVTVNTPEGILMVANSAQSYKESFVGVGGVTVVAVGAALAVPALRMAQERAKEAKAEATQRQQEIEKQIRELDEGDNDAAPDQ